MSITSTPRAPSRGMLAAALAARPLPHTRSFVQPPPGPVSRCQVPARRLALNKEVLGSVGSVSVVLGSLDRF
eukprot:9827764-Alexandrium_andersonii.AAC.1